MAQPRPHYSPAEYLALERESRVRSEYVDGEIFAMAPAAASSHSASVGSRQPAQRQ